MAKVGYTLMTEQAGPKDLVQWAVRAEEAGFDLLASSDHYFPWLDEQGHAPNAWVTLGAVAQATERAELMTYVTCPTMRYHPAVVAQQAATLALLSDNRFTLGLGAGENLNEHVVGEGWPDADQRQSMLAEAVGIIRELLDGGYVNYEGAYFRANAARLWDLPSRPLPLGVAVSGQQSCELFAPLADAMIAVEPDGSLGEWWDAASGTGQPARKIGQLPVCWGADRDECVRRAHEQFRWFGGGWKVNAELPSTSGFAGATSFVRPQDVAGSIPCGDSVDAVAAAAAAFFKAGFTDLALIQIGGTDAEQDRFFAAAPELITALKETAG
jgi:G6PDH family F420-dependent oxidoreductase